MAKPKRRKATLHSAGRVTEQEILASARALRDDPAHVIPQCDGSCVLFSPVKAARRQMPLVYAARDDESKLQRLAGRGNDLARAFAATLLLAKADTIPFVADLKLGGEVVPYVMRGKAKPFFLAGLQHHEDRKLRLLAVAPWSRKRGMHFFSAERGIVCTGKRAAPPADFVREELALLGLDEQGGCGHDGDAVMLRWEPANVTLSRCAACAGTENTFLRLSEHMAGPRLYDQFHVDARLGGLGGEVTPALREAYVRGQLTDAKLLEGARLARAASLRAAGKAYATGETLHADVNSFLAALSPTPEEARALRAGLAAHEGGLVLDRASVARAFAALWPTQGRRMLEAVSDAATADALHREKVAPDEAVEIVRRAAREGAGRAALSTLPRYRSLPPAAAAADAVARTFRTQGREAAVRAAQDRANAPKAKAASLGMLVALDAQRGTGWRFSQGDHDAAAAMAPHVETLLRGDAKGYHEALAAVSLLSGETAPFAPE